MEYNWTDQEKDTCLMILHGQAMDFLIRVPAVARYEEHVVALSCSGSTVRTTNWSCHYRSQLKAVFKQYHLAIS
jgi:hypothetical protein